LAISRDHKDARPTRVLTSKIIKLEKLKENKLEAQNNVGTNQWNIFLWNQQKHTKKNSNLEIIFCGFLREKKHTRENSRKDDLIPLGYNIAYLIILLFLFMLIILNQT